MKKIIYLLIATTIIAGCATSKKYYQKGQYDAAVRKAVQKIRKKPDNKKNIDILEKAYPLANNIDLERIKFLKSEGRPDIWDEVFKRYSMLKDRQSLVKTVCPLNINGKIIDFQFRDYDKDIIEAKKKAAEYFYVHGKKLLDKGDKFAARKAYEEFKTVKSYYSAYENVDELLEKARIKGMSYALVKFINNAHIKLPEDFKDNLISQDYMKLNRFWLEYDKSPRTGINYDYDVVVNLKIIDTSPEAIKEETITESKKVDDGFEYALDANGNVMKDSLGNDIKIPKTKTITCYVIKTFQHKSAHLEGTIDYYDLNAEKIIKSRKIMADQVFDHMYVVANGDLEALNEETKKWLGTQPVPFPTDFDMIFGAGEVLKKVIFDALYNNKQLLN